MDNIRKIRIIFTSDIHGNYFPYDFRRDCRNKGSLQRVHAFVAQQVKRYAGSFILIDGGDMLQGEPTSYYFNFVSNTNRHKVADMCNFIGYDVGVIGNHDIEGGHKVFDAFVRDCNFPILGANAINEETGVPYFEPYTIFKRSGIKVAVIGFITPAIPHWIPKRIWKDIRFEDIPSSAAKWVKIVKETHNPDFIIGLFHSGMDEGIVTPEYRENAVKETVSSVDGFDLVLYGHDHASNMEEIESPSGKSVLCVNPGSYAQCVAEVQVKFNLDSLGKVTKYDQVCNLCYIGTISNLHARDYSRHYRQEFEDVLKFSSEKIGHFVNDVSVADAYFGSSAYIDLIQTLQLYVSKADLSFAAPLFFNSTIKSGDVKISDLFNLYRFEDRLYTLKLYGREIQNYLNMSYFNWVHHMDSADDNFLKLSPMKKNPHKMGFENYIFNFDSAAGIKYEVDVTLPEEHMVKIISMADGTPFEPDKLYTVAVTAYRANGGGELLTKGAGLTKEQIEDRIVTSTDHDIRYYLMEYIKKFQTIDAQPKNLWKFVPDEFVSAAAIREREILFGNGEDSDEANNTISDDNQSNRN